MVSARRFGGIFGLICGTMILAGCETPPDPVITTAGGATRIEIRSGMNCYQNKCFRWNSDGSINVTGRRNVSPPAGVNLASGSITPDQFMATFNRGMSARTIGGQNR